MSSNVEKELYDFIDSLGRARGEYNSEELYEIGKRHKNLPREFKNWTALANYVGYKGNADSYRRFINRHYNQNEEMARVVSQIPQSQNAEYETLYKEKTKIRDIYNNYRLTLRDEARLESFKETLINAAEKQRDLPQIMLASSNNQKSEALLLLGDWHIGQKTDNFYNKYDRFVAKNRIQRIVSSTVAYCKKHNVKILNIINLGDLIEGIINENARLTQEIDLSEEIICAAEYMAEAVNLLKAAAPIVTYRSCTDNHSRSVSNRHEAIEKENFNKLIDWYVRSRLEGSNIKFMDDNIDPGFGLFELSNGMKVGFMHGHEGIKNQTLQEVVGAVQEWVDIICLGHWHNPAEHVYQNMRVFVNGSLCGTGAYALKHRLFTAPSQKLIILDDIKNIINIDIQAEAK